MLTINTRTALKTATALASAMWIGLTFWQQFVDVDPNAYAFRSPEVEERMKSCSGSFSERYECKEAIIIAKGHESFLIWIEKTLLILGPPLLLAYLVGRTGRSEYDPGAEYEILHRKPPPVGKWRVR